MPSEQPTPIRQPLLPVEPAVPGRTIRLPAPLSTFVGRQEEIAYTTGLIRNRQNRLITLTGTGGVGKSRLALIAVAETAPEFPHGAAFIDLSSIHDPELVVPAMAQALGIRLFDEQSTLEALKALLRPRAQLLLLDNFEQVIDAAPQIASLLVDCPELTAVVTSRAALQVSGECIVPVQPLILPDLSAGDLHLDLDAVAANEAVRLFIERVRTVRPGFVLTDENARTIAALCARLDGLPLAIELAAARGALISLQEMLDRLDHRLPLLSDGARDLPARQQTMRDAIAWSYDLLSEREQAVFRCLSVFVGGFRLDAAEAVCGPMLDGMSDEDVSNDRRLEFLAVAESLARQCLIQAVPAIPDAATDAERRLTMLETVREFATEARLASDDRQASQRHAAYFRTMVAAAEPTFWGDERGDWGAVIQSELGNIRAAISWAMHCNDADSALQLSGALLEPQWMFNYQWLGSAESRWHQARVQRALSLAGGAAEHRVKALIIASCLAEAHGQPPEAKRLLDEAINLARTNNDLLGQSTAAFFRGRSAYRRGDIGDARRWMTNAQDGFRAAGARGRMAWSLCFLASFNSRLAIDEGGSPSDLERAERYCDEALAVFRAAEYIPGIQRSLHGLAYTAYKRRDFPRSLTLTHELIELAISHTLPLYDYLDDVADIAGRMSRPEVAARLYGSAWEERLRHASELPPVFQAESEQDMSIAREALGAEEFTRVWEEGRALPLEQAVAEALEFAAAGSRPTFDLTRREREILPLVATGLTAREIGEALFLSHRTVENHLAHLYAKLGVRTRAEALNMARAAQLLPDSLDESD